MAAPNTIGRYEITRQIGAGSQGTVYLAEDPKLKRNVAIKMLDKNLMGDQSDSLAFEQEAQALGRFQHQNIVSVYDIGSISDNSYIVFEYVEGELLSDYIKSYNLEMPEIIELMLGIAAGVSKAHHNGVVHRDLKPQNIIINEEGIPKIMDFGIAMMIEEGSTSNQVVGTPRYMAPEYVRQKVVTPGIDVFSLGAIFYELITGKTAFAGASTSEVLAKILIGPPQPPSMTNQIADDVVDGICLKALAANPRDRYQDAGKLHEVLKNYQKDNAQVAAVDSQGKATLEFLYRRMQRKKDFPALAGSIRAINQLKSNSKEDAEKLAALIVNDFALTNKILKVVNSAYYGTFSGKISTISRAIVVLGVDQVRALASSLIFFEHMSNQTVAVKLKRLMASSLFRAIFSEQISEQAKIENTEEAFLCSMFYQLGQALVAYYLPDEDQDIERMLAKGEKTETEITLQVMGVTFEEIGAFIAKQWNFPKTIVNNIKKPDSGKLQRANNADEKYRLITYMSEEATKALSEGGSKEDVEKVLKRYSEVLPVKPQMAEGVMEIVRENFSRMSQKLLREKNLDSRISNLHGKKPAVPASKVTEPDWQESGTINIDSVLNDETPTEEVEIDAEAILSHGLQEATSILLDSGDVSNVFNTVLETMYRGMEFRRVFLCLAKGGAYSARMGFGVDIKDVLKNFKITMDGSKNVFSVALKKGVDVYIADVNQKKIREDLPKWFFETTDAGSFVLFPLQMKDRNIGFIYGEFERANQMHIEPKIFNLIKSLRNQMILALKQR